MRFKLYFDGTLRSRQQAGIAAVHEIREYLAPQVKDLWSYTPLDDAKDRWPPGEFTAVDVVDGHDFVSVVSERMGLVGEVALTILRPMPPGHVVSKSGDLDNRLKTLVDALRTPSRQEVMDGKKVGLQYRDRHFTVFQDDKLITHLSVSSDRLYGEAPGSSRSLIFIDITVKIARPMIKNLDFV